MKNFGTVLILLVLLAAISSSQVWQVQVNPASGDVKQVYAVNENFAYAITDQQLLKTTNAGINWNVIFTPGPSRTFYGMQWINFNRGFVRYREGYYKTTDGGSTWTDTHFGSGFWMSEIQFLTDSIIYRIPDWNNQTFYYTTNTGSNWYTNQITGGMQNPAEMHFINEQTGFVTGYPSKMAKTTNRGFNWTTPNITFSNSTENGTNFTFLSEFTGYFTDSYKTFKTTDGGNNWTSVSNLGTASDFGLFFNDVNSGWMTNSAGLYKTTNGAVNWVLQNTGVNITMTSVSFINYNTGWISGVNGHILRTTNGSGVLAPIAPTLISPPNNSSGQGLTPLLDWDSISTAVSYRLQLSADSTFGATLIDVQNITSSQYQVSAGVLANNVKYFWRVKASNIGGESPYSTVWNFRTALVGISHTGNETPVLHKLYNNYPNPFNPVTKIKFDIPEQSFTKLTIYDIIGKQVSVLVNRELNPGSYEAEFNASNLPSGVYFYKLQAGVYIGVKKMILVK